MYHVTTVTHCKGTYVVSAQMCRASADKGAQFVLMKTGLQRGLSQYSNTASEMFSKKKTAL